MGQPDTPELSVIIPVHNRAELLQRTLDSVAAQTTRRFHLIIVDNGSTDSSPAIISRWMSEHPDFSCEMVRQPLPGACNARNAGLARVTTPWTMHFDSDDVMLPDHLALTIRAIGDNPDADIIGWDTILYPLDGKPSVKPFWADRPLYHCIMHGGMGTQRWVARTGLLRRAGGWDPTVRGWNDVELGVRMLNLRPRVVRRPGPITVEIHSSAESITGTRVSTRAGAYTHAVCLMRQNLPPRLKVWAGVKMAVLAADCLRDHSPQTAATTLARALEMASTRTESLAVRFAYTWRRFGGRGAARLLAPFLSTR